MNATFLYAATVAIALISSTAAMASEAAQFDDAAGGRSRAEVKAELLTARSQGQLAERGESYGAFQPAAKSTLTRTEVLADAARAKREQRVPSNVYGYLEPRPASLRSRDEVRAEARAQARADAQLTVR